MKDPRIHKLRWFLRNLRYTISVIVRIYGRDVINRTCPCCNYLGRFGTFGDPPRYDALCPVCDSLERHRLIALAARKMDFFNDKEVLHFAPEATLSRIIALRAKKYITADIAVGRADIVLNIENIHQHDESWDVVVCSHVLEHVNDQKAFREIHRILRKNGLFVCMVPLIEGWAATYENPLIETTRHRRTHFGHPGHVRYYGCDIRDRITSEGFSLREYTAYGPEVVEYGLTKGEKIFLCTK